jgi:hypothetical protein
VDNVGAYMTCVQDAENFDANEGRFFVKHENLRWIKTDGKSYDKIEGIILIGYLFLGRINITSNNGSTYQQLGKIYGENIYYRDPETLKEVNFNGAFDILACSACSYVPAPGEPCCNNSARGKYCCLNGSNSPDCSLKECGSLINLNRSDPAVDGFLGGQYDDGSKIYVGLGDFSACWGQSPAPARIMFNSSNYNNGAFSSCGAATTGEYFDNQKSQYFYNHPDMKWVPSTAASAASIQGAIKVGMFYVGRKWLISKNRKYHQIGKIVNGVLYYKIPGKNQEFTSDGDIDVLVCSACSNGGKG